MKSIVIGEGIPYLRPTDTKILSSDQTIERVIIHKDVQVIAPFAFYGKAWIREILFQPGSQCHTIDQKAFLWCMLLEKIQFPFSLVHIKQQAFQFCISLKTIVFPPLITYIESLSFSYCYKLHKIILLNNNVKINPNAFIVTRIAECQLFNSCYKVTHIHGQVVFYHNERTVGERKVAYGTLVNRIVDGQPVGDKKFVVWSDKAKIGPIYMTGYGNKLKEAIQDLDFIENERNIPDRLRNLSEEDYITMEDYQILTGDCKYGVEQFLTMHDIALDDKLQVKEIIEMTKDNPRGNYQLLQRYIESGRQRRINEQQNIKEE